MVTENKSVREEHGGESCKKQRRKGKYDLIVKGVWAKLRSVEIAVDKPRPVYNKGNDINRDI